jgi:hypothetical protein
MGRAIAAFTIVEELDLGDRGYFRARVTLSNDDFLFHLKLTHHHLYSL